VARAESAQAAGAAATREQALVFRDHRVSIPVVTAARGVGR
jgi:hypothetical protein